MEETVGKEKAYFEFVRSIRVGLIRVEAPATKPSQYSPLSLMCAVI